MSCRCRKCREKLNGVETYNSKIKKGSELVAQRRAADVYGSGSNSYSHINAHNERLKSGPVSPPRKVVTAKPVASISPESEVKCEPEKKEGKKCSNSAILETNSDGVILRPGQVLKFNKGISGGDNSGSVIVGPDTITFKSAGMYRFVFTFAVEDSAPNSIYISMSKSDPDHSSFQTLTVYNDGVNICSTILPVKEDTEVKFQHPGGKNKAEIKFVGPVRVELYEV